MKLYPLKAIHREYAGGSTLCNGCGAVGGHTSTSHDHGYELSNGVKVRMKLCPTCWERIVGTPGMTAGERLRELERKRKNGKVS